MAKQTALKLFLGEDKQLQFSILNDAETAAVDITGWSCDFMIKRRKSDLDANAVLTKTASVSGIFNASPALNTQIAIVFILDTDTTALAEGLCLYELKRMDANFETVLSYGTIELMKAVHA